MDEVTDWYLALDADDTQAVFEAIELLAARGVTLGHPYSSAINGSRYAMRELRVQSHGRPLRVLYAFDPQRQAVLLLGADKTGDARFYTWAIPKAERRWEEYLRS